MKHLLVVRGTKAEHDKLDATEGSIFWSSGGQKGGVLKSAAVAPVPSMWASGGKLFSAGCPFRLAICFHLIFVDLIIVIFI